MAQPTAGAASAAPPEDPSASTSAQEPDVERESVVDAAADLGQLIIQYLRQEAEALVREKVARPIQNAGAATAFAFAAAFVLVLGLCFLVAAEVILLADFVGWPASLAINGIALMGGAAGLTYARMRRSV